MSPDPRPPKPAARPIPLLGSTATSVFLVGASCVAGVLNAWSGWYRHSVVIDYQAGEPGVWVADLTTAESTTRTASVLYVFAMTAAAVALLVWYTRLRANARLHGQVSTHPLRRGLALTGWFTVTGFAFLWVALPGPDVTTEGLRLVAAVNTGVAAVQCAVGLLLVWVLHQVTGRRERPA